MFVKILFQEYSFYRKTNLLAAVLFSSFSSRHSDGLSHSAKRLSESHRLDLMRNITELLGRTFPSQFVFPVLGHEDVQNNDYKDYKSFLLSLGNIWRQWLPLEALQTFEKGNIIEYGLLFLFALTLLLVLRLLRKRERDERGFCCFGVGGWIIRSGIYIINFADALG